MCVAGRAIQTLPIRVVLYVRRLARSSQDRCAHRGSEISESCFVTTNLRETEDFPMANAECRQDSLDFGTIESRSVVGALAHSTVV